MYHYFPVTGNIAKMLKEKASVRMDEISDQWEDEETPYGELYLGVHDWAYSQTAQGIELHIPKLASGGSVPLNELASNFFDFEIYGDCFLKADKSQVEAIDTKLGI